MIIGCGRKRHRPERNELRKLMLAMAAMKRVRMGVKGGQQEGSRLSTERETLARGLILKGSCFLVRHPQLISHALRGAASSTGSFSAFVGESRSPVSELRPYMHPDMHITLGMLRKVWTLPFAQRRARPWSQPKGIKE